MPPEPPVEDSDGRPLRIVIVVGSLQIGGTEGQAARLAIELRERGHDVRVLTLAGAGPRKAALDHAGVPVHVIDVPFVIARTPRGRPQVMRSLRNAAELASAVTFLRRVRPDVVQTFLLWPSAIGLTAATLARVPVRVSGRRNLATAASSEAHPFLARLVDRLSHHVVANSQAVAAAVQRTTPVTVIHNGVDQVPRAADVRRQPARGVMVGNLIAYKGHADVITALGSLPDPPAIDVLGEGPERPVLEALIAELDLEDRVRLHGQVSAPTAALAEAQFAVLASHEEGLPNALLEAMAAGLPVVATAVGGVPEVVTDADNGLLVDRGDPTSLAEAIRRVAADPALRQRLGDSARQTCEESFSWARCATRHLALYVELRDRSAPGRSWGR